MLADVRQDPPGEVLQGLLLTGLYGGHQALFAEGIHRAVHRLGKAIRVEEDQVSLLQEELYRVVWDLAEGSQRQPVLGGIEQPRAAVSRAQQDRQRLAPDGVAQAHRLRVAQEV